MANRDQSQKVGFVYTNIYELYKKSKNASTSLEQNEATTRVFRPEDLANIKVTKFEPRTFVKINAEREFKAGPNQFEDLKNNLNRLNDLHAKLRFMLKELEDLVNEGKK